VVACASGHPRTRTATDEREVANLRQATAAGEPVGPIVARYNADIAQRAVPEWQATLDVLQELPEIGGDGPLGYYGLKMGTAIGVPLTAAEPRITAAAFGLFWPESLAEPAKRITVPIEFVLQWDDEHIDRQSGLALVGAFASTENIARQRGQAQGPAQVRGRQRSPVLRPAPRPGPHVTVLMR
jgi:hypothetical protein